MGRAIVWMERLHWAVWPGGAHQSGRHQRSRLRLCNDANSMWPSHPWLLRCKGLPCPPVLSVPSPVSSIICRPDSRHATDFRRFDLIRTSDQTQDKMEFKIEHVPVVLIDSELLSILLSQFFFKALRPVVEVKHSNN